MTDHWLSPLLNPVPFALILAYAGAVAGGFATVVIWRLPRVLLAPLPADAVEEPDPLAALGGHSLCDGCGRRLGWLEKAPLIGLVRRPACPACGHRAGLVWPLVELAAALCGPVAVLALGPGWAAAGAALLGWALIALFMIDLDHMLLPDLITMPLIWAGLVAALWLPGWPVALPDAVAGAVVGWAGPALLTGVMGGIFGREMMGGGDLKLFAALGAWCGAWLLPFILLLSALTGLAIFAIARLRGRGREHIPFGPAIAAAGWLVFLWGDQLWDLLILR